MPNVIDDAVVKMQFDNQDFENNVSKSMSTLDKLKEKLNFKGSSEGLDRLGNKIKGVPLDSLSSAVNGVGNRFRAMEIMSVTALANITNSVVNTGKQLLSSLTIAPIYQGYNEYELKLGSIQTIMASTGETIDKVNSYINELNTYADKTIYSFSDMTNNIGKFTNAGVKLKDAVAAIQGISNAAALSGSNAEQASHAMYNFAQALSAGYVKLIDWKSIEIAGMATVGFKNELIKTAEELGTIVKVGDKYKTVTTDMRGRVSELFDETHAFNESLSYQWMSTEVLTKTLAKYSDETTDIGKKAFEAATKVKSFTQLMDTLQEAVGSGWAQTFELLFGNLNEAKELWTAVNNVVGTFVDKTSDLRNFRLNIWADGVGKEAAFKGLQNVFEGIAAVVKPMGEGIRKVFAPITGGKLVQISQEFEKLTARFKEFTSSLYVVNRVRYIFEGLASAIKIVQQVGKGVIDAFIKPLAESLNIDTKLKRLLDFLADIAKEITKFKDSQQAYFKTMEIIQNGLSMTIHLSDIFVGAWHKILTAVEGFVDFVKGKVNAVFEGLRKEIDAVLDSMGLMRSESIRHSKALRTIIITIATLIATFGKAFTGFDIMSGGFKKLVNSIFGANVNQMIQKFQLGKFLKEISDSAKDAQKNIKGAFAAIIEGVVSLSAKFKAEALFELGKSLGLIAASLWLLSKIDPTNIKAAGGALAALAVGLTLCIGAITKLNSISGGEEEGKGFFGGLVDSFFGDKAALDQIISIGVALLLLAVALRFISGIPIPQMAASLSALLVGLYMLVEELKAIGELPSGKHAIAVAAAIAIFGTSLIPLALALKIMSTVPFEKMAAALLQLIVGLSMMTVALKELANLKDIGGKKMLASAAAIVAVSATLIPLALALKLMSTINIDQMGVALAGLVVGLGAMAGVLYLLSNSIASGKDVGGKKLLATAAAIRVTAGALIPLAVALKLISTIDGDKIGQSLGAVFALLAMVGTTLGVLGTFGGLMIQAGIGITAIAFALNLLVPVLVVLGALPFAIIASGIFNMCLALGALILMGALASSAAVGLLALGASMLMMSSAVYLLAVALPKLAENSKYLSVIIPELGKAFLELVKTIVMMIPEMVKVVTTGIVALIRELAKAAPQIITETVKLAIAMADALIDQIPVLVDAAFRLVISLIEGLATAIDEHHEELNNAIIHLGEAIIKAMIDLGKKIYNKINDITGGALERVRKKIAGFVQAGKDVLLGLWKGITNAPIVQKVKNAVGKIGGKLLETFKKIFGIASPSKVMKGMGKYICIGLMQGFQVSEDGMIKQTENTFGKVLDTITKTVKGKMKYAKGAFQETTNMLKPSIKDYDDSKKAIGAATNALHAFVLQQYQQSDAYKQDKENIKKAKKDLKAYNKDLEKARKSRKKGRANEVKNLKKKVKEARKALKDAKKAVDKNIADTSTKIHTEIADSLKSFMDPLSLNINESSPYEEFIVPTYDDINKVAELNKQYKELNEKFEALDDSQKNTRAAHNLLAEIDEVGAKLDEAEEKLGNVLTADQLVKNMESQANAENIFQENLKKAAEKGLSPDIIADLRKQGKEANSTLVAFLEMDSDQISRSNKAFSKKAASDASAFLDAYLEQTEAAKKWSSDMEELFKRGISQKLLMAIGEAGPESQAAIDKLLAMTSDEFKKFSDTYDSNFKLDDKLADQVYASYALAGTNCAKGFADGLMSSEGLKAAEKAAKKLAKKVVKQVNKYLGIHSPSRVFRQIGLYSDEGLAEGFEAGADSLSSRVIRMLGGLETDIADKLASLSDDESTEFKLTPVIEGTEQARIWIDEFKAKMQEVTANAQALTSSKLAGNISSNFTYKAGDDISSILGEMKRLQTALNTALEEDRINQTNEFHIESNDPEGVADEVSKILQRQVERRSATWA